MNPIVQPYPHRAPIDPSRRDLLNGVLLLGAAGVLASCQAHKQSVARLPTPVWPDADKNATVSTAPTHVHDLSNAPLPPLVSGLPPGVLPRSAWTTSVPNVTTARPKSMNGVQRITVHHSAVNSSNLLTKSDAARQIEAFRVNHTSRKDPETGLPWVDIGYHYIIDPSGRIFEGRPVTMEGAHVSHTNQHNIGVMMMGNFDDQHPTRSALDSLDAFVAGLMRRYHVTVASVFTHQELRPTECPGKNLQRYMVQTRATSGRMAMA